MAATEDASWAAAIQRYDFEKRIIPSPQDPYVPHRMYRDGRFCQKDVQREYDPLTHKWRDSEKELSAKQRELTRDFAAMETAKARAMRYESHYDVITNTKKIDAPDEPKPKPKYEPPPEIPSKPREIQHRGRALYYWPGTEKEFHVINNRYLADHNERAGMDRQRILDNAKHQFGSNNHYNAVQGKLYDPLEEQKYQQARAQAQLAHGSSKLKRQPLSVKTREGALYDITAPQSVLNREQLLEYERRKQEERDGTQLKQTYEAELATRSHKAQTLKDERGINRISHDRHLAVVKRGYNILTNQDFKGRTGKPHPASYTRSKPPHPLRHTNSLSASDAMLAPNGGQYGRTLECA